MSFLICDTFVKANITDLNFIVEALLYNGEYLLNGKPVTILQNGQVKNFAEYDYFQAMDGTYNVQTINN